MNVAKTAKGLKVVRVGAHPVSSLFFRAQKTYGAHTPMWGGELVPISQRNYRRTGSFIARWVPYPGCFSHLGRKVATWLLHYL